MEPEFEYDEAKNIANIRKHGVPLTAGIKVLMGDESFLLIKNMEENGEERWVTTGPHPEIPGLLVVIHHERMENVIRLISVRKANSKERRNYAEEI